MIKTHEGAAQYEHSLDHLVEFFSKAGSLRTGGKGFYPGQESALSLFQKAWIVDQYKSMQLLLWLRDCRGGAGNRSGARACYAWLAEYAPEWLVANIGWLPLVGRWDDFKALFGTQIENLAAQVWAEALKNSDVLAAKWADRKMIPIRKIMGLNEAGLRVLLSGIRKNHIVEHAMCSKNWGEINYEHVPSVAMARYTKAFGRNDSARFDAFKAALEKGEAAVHAGVLFPHDCVLTAFSGDQKIADAQFEALPNFMEGTDEKILVLCDTSGSMQSSIGGSVQAVHVSTGLALYCSARMPANGPFYKKFIGFGSEGKFVDWNGMSFSQALHSRKVFDGAVASTRIDRALDTMLDMATFFKVPAELMPTTLLIVSDMQFTSVNSDGANSTVVKNCMARWEKAGYRTPKIVYWNTAGYAGSPDTVKSPNTGLVSGFSPSILKAILTGDDFSPRGIMERAIEKYRIVAP